MRLMVDSDTSIMPDDRDITADASGTFSIAIAGIGESDATGRITFLAEGAEGSLASAPVKIVSSTEMSH